MRKPNLERAIRDARRDVAETHLLTYAQYRNVSRALLELVDGEPCARKVGCPARGCAECGRAAPACRSTP